MPSPNKHLESALENFYRREALHISIFTFIDTYRFLFESIPIDEAIQAYMKRYKINEDMFSVDSIKSIYNRVNKDLIDLHRHKDSAKAFPIKV